MIDKFKSEIERQRANLSGNPIDDYGAHIAYDNMLEYLNSLEKEPLFRWHPATESPGKRRVLMAFTRKDLKKGQYVFSPVRLFADHAIPAECVFEDGDDGKQLPVAWAYYDEAINGITEKMCKDAAAYAWGWWPDDK